MRIIPIITILVYLISWTHPLPAEETAYSTTHSAFCREAAVPVVLISAGLLLNHSTFEQDLQTALRNAVGNDFEFRIDDWFQYAPAAGLPLAWTLDIPGRHSTSDQVKYLLISDIVSSGITQSIKYITLKTRPNGGSYSFPSGHTTFAFTNAAVLWQEYHTSAPILANSGWVFAATTGAFRMINNKHWLSDVLTGAGIGILTVQALYAFKPLENIHIPGIGSAKVTILPQWNEQGAGCFISAAF